MEKHIEVNGIKYKPVKIADIRKEISFTTNVKGCGFCSFAQNTNKACVLAHELRPCVKISLSVFMDKILYIKTFKHKYNPYK